MLFPLNFMTAPMIVMGFAATSAGHPNYRLVLAGYNANGTLALGYGNQGKIVTQVSTYNFNQFVDAFTTGDGKVTAIGAVDNQ